jgi:hypothetical protein
MADEVKYKKLQGVGGQDEPYIVRGEDMTEMMHSMTQGLMWMNKSELAYFSSIDVMSGDVLGLADSCAYDLNIGSDVWLTESRWSTLIRQYVNPIWLFTFLDGVKELSTYGRGIVALDMNRVEPTIVAANARANRRKRGGCMRFLTYRAFPYPTISLYSRTSYLGYIGSLDLLLAHKITELAADMIGDGLKVDDFHFRWHVEAVQLHMFKAMAYIFSAGLEDYLTKKWPTGRVIVHPVTGRKMKLKEEKEYPSWYGMRKWYERIQRLDAEGLLYEDMKYGAEKRVRRRLHAAIGVDQEPFLGSEKEYSPLDLPIEQVTLDRMTYKTPESRAVIRRHKREKAEALINELFSDDELLVGSGAFNGKLGATMGSTDPTDFNDLVDDVTDLVEGD